MLPNNNNAHGNSSSTRQCQCVEESCYSMVVYPRIWLALSLIMMMISVVRSNDDTDGIDLGGGIITQTNVQSFADLSQDVAGIRNFLAAGQVEQAKGLFRSGLNSERVPGVKRSLASLSDEMANADPKTPVYLFNLYGISQRSVSTSLDGTQSSFAKNWVLEIMDTSPEIAHEAIWAITMYLYATHLLFTGVYNCQKHSKADNPTVFNVGTANWDQFIALYVGSGQTAAESNGNSLYTFAQIYGDKLGKSDPEASVNTRIKSLYQQAMAVVNVNTACTSNNDGTDTARLLWKLAIQTSSELSKPIFQGFLHALTVSKDAALTKLYAQALVPQLAKCRPSLYKRMYETFITNGATFDLNDELAVQAVLDDLPDATSCFGYSCGELAASTGVEGCQYEFESYLSYAGYVPISPVRAVGMADLDVYQMKVLLELQARDFATYLYLHGANIAKFGANREDPMLYVSLHEIATTSERESAKPWYDNFIDYNQDEFYADTVIQTALLLDIGNEKNKWKSTEQVMAIVASTAAYQILLLEAVAKIEIATTECTKSAKSGEPPSFSLDPIDEMAALLVGSMEGSNLGGSPDLEDGQLIYNINNRHAFQFGTMDKDGAKYSHSVSTMEDLLYAARGQLDALDCDSLETTTREILKHAMVGIAQGCIFLGDKNYHLTSVSTSGDLALAEGLALSIIPLIAAEDKALADKLKKNFVWVPGNPTVPDGPVETGKAMGEGFTRTMELGCSNLGSIESVNPCDGSWGKMKFGSTSGAVASSRVVSPTAVVTTVGLVVLFLFLG